MTKVKICGITNPDDAVMAADAGADALGFIFAPSPRQVSPEFVKNIIRRLPPFLSKVGVFKDMDLSRVLEIMDFCSLDLCQFHGSIGKTAFKILGHRGIKVFEAKDRGILAEIKAYDLSCFMIDLPKDNSAVSLDKNIVQDALKLGKVILAGRLTPDNIQNTLIRFFPYAVDVCRGVEKKPGIKDPRKMKDFISKVRTWNEHHRNI